MASQTASGADGAEIARMASAMTAKAGTVQGTLVKANAVCPRCCPSPYWLVLGIELQRAQQVLVLVVEIVE